MEAAPRQSKVLLSQAAEEKLLIPAPPTNCLLPGIRTCFALALPHYFKRMLETVLECSYDFKVRAPL